MVDIEAGSEEAIFMNLMPGIKYSENFFFINYTQWPVKLVVMSSTGEKQSLSMMYVLYPFVFAVLPDFPRFIHVK